MSVMPSVFQIRYLDCIQCSHTWRMRCPIVDGVEQEVVCPHCASELFNLGKRVSVPEPEPVAQTLEERITSMLNNNPMPSWEPRSAEEQQRLYDEWNKHQGHSRHEHIEIEVDPRQLGRVFRMMMENGGHLPGCDGTCDE